MASTDAHIEDEVDSQNERRILDPVHDYVVFEPRVAALIDTPQFQRLRYLKQLGTAYFVFPGASHNRFEHSLGVSHLARLMVDGLRSRQPNLGITERDVLCVQIAGLVHDLGHGPFSHVFDSHFIPRVLPGQKWSHEEASEMMFDSLLTQNQHIKLEPSWVDLIKDLIRGRQELTRWHDPPEKPFLFQIVANMANGIDVDKFDYIARDTLNYGDKTSVTTSRFISSCRVIKNEVAYHYKDYFNLCELFHTRYSLHKRIYNHKTAKAIEYMVVDALIAANTTLRIAEKIRDPLEYLYLTDSILEEIERSKDAALADSRALIARIRKRDLYKRVEYKMVPVSYKEQWGPLLTPERIAEESAKLPYHDPDLKLEPNDVIVDWALLHWGMKDQNPLQLVCLYGKGNPNESFIARPDEGSLLLPEQFQEIQLSIFTRDARKSRLLQEAYRSILCTLPDVPTPSASVETPAPVPLSPPSPSLSEVFEAKTPPKAPVTPLLPSFSQTSFTESSSPGTGLRRHRSFKEPNQFATFDGTKIRGQTTAHMPSLVEQRKKRVLEEEEEVSGHEDSSFAPPRNKTRIF